MTVKPKSGTWSLHKSGVHAAGTAYYLPGVPTHNAETAQLEALPLVINTIGTGAPPRRNIIYPYGHRAGGFYQGAVTMPRQWYMRILLEAGTFPELMALHEAWAGKLQPDDELPITLRYHGQVRNLDISGVVEGGLEKGAEVVGNTIELPLRIMSYIPYFRGTTRNWTKFYPTASLTPGNAFIRKADGTYAQAVSSGTVYCFRYIDDVLWAGGTFTTIGGVTANRIAYYDEDLATWVQPGSGFNGTVWDIVRHPDGRILAVGDFLYDSTGAGTIYRRIAIWNGTSWAQYRNPAAITSGGIRRAIFGHDGYLYVFGDFVNLDTTMDYLAKNNGSGWAAAGTEGGEITEALIAPDGKMYLFVGSDTPRYKSYDGSTITDLGSGAGGSAPTMGPDGYLYAAKSKSIERWNGDSWEVVWDDGLSAYSVYRVDARGTFWLNATAVGYTPARARSQTLIPAFFAQVTKLGASFSALAIHEDGRAAFGIPSLGSVTVEGRTTVTTAGNAKTWPTFQVTGPGQLVSIINWTTGKEIYFDNLNLYDGETVTLDMEAGTFESNWRGNILDRILEGSDYSLTLEPGANEIGIYVTDTGAPESYVYWYDQYMGIGGGEA